jgi:hypothetical protein
MNDEQFRAIRGLLAGFITGILLAMAWEIGRVLTSRCVTVRASLRRHASQAVALFSFGSGIPPQSGNRMGCGVLGFAHHNRYRKLRSVV